MSTPAAMSLPRQQSQLWALCPTQVPGAHGGGQERLMSSRRSAVRGPQPINPLLVSQEGKPGCGHLFILDFTFLFSL